MPEGEEEEREKKEEEEETGGSRKKRTETSLKAEREKAAGKSR